jgi:hypothetical protein
LINNFNELNLRNDVGHIWENFLIIERIKYLEYANISNNKYFWRSYTQQEVNYIEEENNQLSAFEFKFNSKNLNKPPSSFDRSYPHANYQLINKDNWVDFVR